MMTKKEQDELSRLIDDVFRNRPENIKNLIGFPTTIGPGEITMTDGSVVKIPEQPFVIVFDEDL